MCEGWRKRGVCEGGVGGRGCERVRLEEEKECEGKVEWGWRKGRGVREDRVGGGKGTYN